VPNEGRPPGDHQDVPELSAIVVIPDRYETVRATMECLKKQTAAKKIEIVFVVSECSPAQPDETDLECFHSWKIVTESKVNSISHGFTAGISQAGAPVVALTEDHSYPDSRWAELFIERHQEHWAAVGPSMRNGNPVNVISRADFCQAYGQWAHPVASGPVRHLPGHNSSYKKDLLLSFGSDLPILMQAESVLHRRLKAQGYDLLLEAETCTSHLNFNSWSNWIPARYYAGRQFAGTWATGWPPIRRLFYVLGSPGIPWLRLWRVRKSLGKEPGLFKGVKLALAILAGFIVEAAGNLAGFAAGTGDSNLKIALYEFHRIK
jgi:hypothetical protein